MVIGALPQQAQAQGEVSSFTFRHRIEFNFGVDVQRTLYAGILGYRVPLTPAIAIVPEANFAALAAFTAAIRYKIYSGTRWGFFLQPGGGYAFSAGAVASAVAGAEYSIDRSNSYLITLRAFFTNSAAAEKPVAGKSLRSGPPVVLAVGFSF